MTLKPSAKPAPLGRGLSALFGDSDAGYQPRTAKTQPPSSTGNTESNKAGTTRMMPIQWIQPGAYQPRRHFDEQAIQELAASIKERGILMPLIVRALAGEKDNYELIAGERRWRAAQVAGHHEVPVIIRDYTDREAMELGLIENVQRQDLSPLEEAEGYERLLKEFSHTQEGLAKVVGKSRPHIANMLRLLTLPAGVKAMISAGELTMGHARTVITAKDPEGLAKEIVKKGLSVRQAESLAKKQSDGRHSKKERVSKNADPDTLALEKEMGRMLGLKVKLHTEGASGSVTVFYNDLDQLDGLIKKLQG